MKSRRHDIPASDHATDLLLDYLEGRLTPESEARVRSHLDACQPCRDLYERSRQWRDDLLAHGARHLPPDRLVALADDRGADPAAAPTEDEQAHLEGCRTCREQLAWLESLPAPPEFAAPARDRAPAPADSWWLRLRRSLAAPQSRVPRWAWGAVAVAAAGLALVLLIRPPSVGPQIAGLARLEPIAVLTVRGPSEAGEFTAAFRNGLEHYAHQTYRQSAENFGRAVRLDPAHETAFLYLGSAELLAGNPEAALEALERGQANSADPELIAEYDWQIANANLAAGRLAPARDRLLRIAAGGSARAGEARELLEQIENARHR